MAYHAGELSERVTIQRKTRTRDAMGGYAETWTDVTTVWALVRPMSGNERALAAQQQASVNYKVVIRYRAVSTQQRLLWRGSPLNIRFIADRGPRAQYLEIEAEMGVET